MAIYRTRVVTQENNVPQPDSGAIEWVPIEITFPPTALLVNDLIELVDLPIGVGVVDYTVVAPQLDSNGTPTLAFSIGHKTAIATDLDVTYEAGLIPGRTANGSVARMGTGVAPVQSTLDIRRLALKVTTAAATSATAGKTITVMVGLKG